jgi:hypothetical protein
MVKFAGLPKREQSRRSPSQLCTMQYPGNTAEFLSNFLRGPRLCLLPSHVFTLPRCYIISYASCTLYLTFQKFRNCSQILPGGGRGFNPLKAELNPICCLLALLGAHHFLYVSRIRVKSLTLRLLMSYIHIYIYI